MACLTIFHTYRIQGQVKKDVHAKKMKQKDNDDYQIYQYCELLVTGTPPSAIPQIIQTFCETLLREKPKELPSVNFDHF